MMKTLGVSCCGISAACLVFLLATAAEAGQEKAQEGMPPEMQAMMAEYAKYAAPGEHHAHLKSMAGTWKAKTTMWMEPGAPPTEDEATSKNTLVLGDRFLMQEFEGNFMGQKFNGLGMVGYDNFKKKYVSSWADTMGTLMMISEGTCDGTGKRVTLLGEWDDPVTKSRKKNRQVIIVENDDKHIFQMFDEMPDGKEHKTMEITYTRE